jgi:hypothetical protein
MFFCPFSGFDREDAAYHGRVRTDFQRGRFIYRKWRFWHFCTEKRKLWKHYDIHSFSESTYIYGTSHNGGVGGFFSDIGRKSTVAWLPVDCVVLLDVARCLVTRRGCSLKYPTRRMTCIIALDLLHACGLGILSMFFFLYFPLFFCGACFAILAHQEGI